MDLCSLDTSDLFSPWPNIQLFQAIQQSFSNNSSPLRLRFWKNAGLLQSTDPRLLIYILDFNGTPVIAKTIANPEDSREFEMGIYINQLRSEIPIFSYTYGTFTCSSQPGEPFCFRSGCKNDTTYILTEYIRGPTLTNAINSNTIPLVEIWACIKIVIEAVKYAHKRLNFSQYDLYGNNIILKEIHPSNVMGISTRYLPMIIDYGQSEINESESYLESDIGQLLDDFVEEIFDKIQAPETNDTNILINFFDNIFPLENKGYPELKMSDKPVIYNADKQCVPIEEC